MVALDNKGVVALRLPLAFVFGHYWGGRGAYVSHAVSLTITGAVSCYLIVRLLKTAGSSCGACDVPAAAQAV